MRLPDSIQLTETLEKELFPALPDVKPFRRFGKILEVTSTLIRSTLPEAKLRTPKASFSMHLKIIFTKSSINI